VGECAFTSKPDFHKEKVMKSLASWKPLGKLWSYWTVSTTISGGLAYPLVVGIAALGGGWPYGFWIGLPVGGVLAGLVAGFWQERVLRPHLQVTKQWIGATALGWAVGLSWVVGISGWFLSYAKEMQPWYALTVYLIGAGVGGVILGTGQWFLLRSRIEKSIWWFMACAVGSLLAWLVISATWYFLGQGADLPGTVADLPAMIVLGGLAGWMMGMEQGVALVGLIAQAEWEKGEKGRGGRGRPISYF
jgi:MFS family permease